MADHSPKHCGLCLRGVSRRLFMVTAVLLVMLAGAQVAHRSTLAGNTVGSFEIDGNLVVDHPAVTTEPIDWESNPFPAALTTFNDGTGSGDDIFGMGSKENDQSTWVCTTGSAPPKHDFANHIAIKGAAP